MQVRCHCFSCRGVGRVVVIVLISTIFVGVDIGRVVGVGAVILVRGGCILPCERYPSGATAASESAAAPPATAKGRLRQEREAAALAARAAAIRRRELPRLVLPVVVASESPPPAEAGMLYL